MNRDATDLAARNVAKAFIERINAGDVAGLAALMTEDHRFVDSLGNAVTGREAMRQGWVGYFGMVPDYRLVMDDWFCEGSFVVMLGTASGTYSPDGSLKPDHHWTTPTAIRAIIRENQVAEWRVYADNEPIRELMRAGS
jgi:ketosteroid isomerase-like protein